MGSGRDGAGESVDGPNAPNKDSKFMQQRLPAWQPLFSPGSVIPGFLLVGTVFIAVGSVIVSLQSDLKHYGPIEYDSIAQCSAALENSPCRAQYNVNYGPDVDVTAAKPLNPLCVPLYFENDTTPDDPADPSSNVCEVTITLTEDWSGPVYFFYILTNFYQNHRLYVADRADNQLTGSNSPSYETLFSDLRGELPVQGCSADVLPGGLFCTGTDNSTPWIPVSSDQTMGTSKTECEAGGHVPPIDAASAASGVWCPCENGVWGACSAPLVGLDAAMYGSSMISAPIEGNSCVGAGTGYSGYDAVENQQGQCWAQFCNPCGRIARSFFTDKFRLLDSARLEVPWEPTQVFEGELGAQGKYGITRTPAEGVGTTSDGSAPLLNVRTAEQNELVTSSDFIVWMRASILPRAKKVHRVIRNGLSAGTYTLQIRSNYDPFIFGNGTKEFVLATVHPTLGGANALLAYSFIGIGIVCVCLGLLFLVAICYREPLNNKSD